MNPQIIKTEIKNLNYQIKHLESELKKLPDGKFLCESSGKRIKWKYRDESGLHPLNKNNKAIAFALAKKRYYSALLSDLQEQHAAAVDYLKSLELQLKSSKLLLSPTYGPVISESLKTNMPMFSLCDDQPSSHSALENRKSIFNSKRKTNKSYNERFPESFTIESNKTTALNTITNVTIKPSDIIDTWINTPFETNPFHPENLIHKTISGQMVRSKSEVLISTCLSQHGIPFKYEAKLELNNNHILYPDFTALNKRTAKFFYWEHFGMIDNEKYRNDALHKLAEYGNNEIYPSVNLLMTFETEETPLDITTVERTITEYLL